jgi:hypothetical protein
VAAPVAVTVKPLVHAVVGMAAVEPGVAAPAQPGVAAPEAASASDLLTRVAAEDSPALAAAAFDRARPSDALADEILASAGVDEALARAQALGAVSSLPSHPQLRLFKLKRLWDAHAPSLVGRRFSIDPSWAIPAIRIKNGETTYLVHADFHGVGFASGREQVHALARQIRRRGHELYSEQNTGAFFGLRFGKEIDDLSSGAAAVARDFASTPEFEALARRFKMARAQAAAFYGLAAGVVALGAGLLLGAWPGVVAAAAAALVVRELVTGGRRIEIAKDLLAVLRAKLAGLPDVSAQMRREAFALNRKTIDPLEVMRLHLPPGLGPDRYAARSDAIAAAVRADLGPKVKHVFVGAAHAARVVWRLSAPQDPGGESQRA